MRCDTNCLTDWADEFNGNQSAYKDIFKDNVLYLIACELDFYQTKILWLGMI